MSTRFVTNAAIALLAGLVVVLSMGLSSTTAVGWAAFGIAIGIVVMSLLVQLDTGRGGVQRLLDAVLVAVGGTLIGVSVFFTGTTLTWLVFALALGLVGTTFIGLAAHEVESWRSIHQLGELHALGRRRPGERARVAETEVRAA